MKRPIDPDLDDSPRIASWNRETLERQFRHFSREFAEERTENRRLKRERQWQPIDSVPLKTDVLLYWPPKRGRTMRAAQQTVGQVHSLANYDGATHWAPLLPEPQPAPTA